MDLQRRRDLERKRLAVQERVRLEERSRGVRRTLDFLDRHGIAYELAWWNPEDREPGADPVRWLVEHFPNASHSAVEIDWEAADGAIRGPEPEAPAPEVVAWFEGLRAEGRIDNGDVTLATDNGYDPMIRLRFGAVREVPQLFQLDGPAWWILAPERGWAIQYRWTEPWWWGRVATGA
jgi:hypothetical protein